MIKLFRKVYAIYIVTDLLILGVSFYLPYLIKYNSLHNVFSFHPLKLVNFTEYSFIFILWTIFIVLFFKRHSLFTTERTLTIPREIFRVIINILYSVLLISAVIFFAHYSFFSREVFIESCLLMSVLLTSWRIIKRVMLRRLISKGFHNINLLIVGSSLSARAFLEEVKKFPWLGFKVVGFLEENKEGSISGIPILGKIKDFTSVVKRYFVDEVIITDYFKDNIIAELSRKIKEMRMGLGLRVIPENLIEPLTIVDISYLGVLPVLTYRKRELHPSASLLKKFFDFTVALTLLIFALPLIIFVGILIKLDSRGSIFYIQKRVGLKGNQFDLYKFRSMVKDADKLKSELLQRNEVKGGVIFKIKDDPRITWIGRRIRNYSIDELPQLINVLKGDMSLVGPRPPTPEEVIKYKDEYMLRLSVRPGITGLAQVKGRSDLGFYRWMRWDGWYVNNWSFGLDLKILWWTIPSVLKRKGAY